MKAQIIFLLLLFATPIIHAQKATDSLLTRLDSVISKQHLYTKEKLDRISVLKRGLSYAEGDARYAVVKAIYEEYKSFVYDSAAVYAMKLQEIAFALNDREKIADAKIKLAFTLTSSGLLNEALDTLNTLCLKRLPDSVKVQYYYLMVRTCYDLADFSQNRYYGAKYEQLAKAYVDSASALLSPASIEYLVMNGLRDLRMGNISSARHDYEELVFRHKLNGQQFAIAASTLSHIYSLDGEPGKSRNMLVRAVIADIESSTKETFALVKLADVLHNDGNIEKAYQYIQLAMEDANYYGARYRKQQLAGIFPIIEGERLSSEEAKKKLLLIYSVAITGSVIVFIAFLYIIKKKNYKLRKAQRTVKRANDKLAEANRIKEEYLWYFFNVIAENIATLETFKTRILTKKIEQVKLAAERLDIKEERHKLFHNFDIVFLKLFPDFVTVFNSLLEKEHHVVLKDGQLLSMEMRIFALIRLGIHDHEKIAKILGYSLTTVYTYKARIKSKAIVSSEDFDTRIENIATL